MFDIEKELNEIRSIKVSPSDILIQTTTEMVKKRNAELLEKRVTTRRSNIIKLSKFASLPAAAGLLLAVVIGLVAPKAASYYTLDMDSTVVFSADEDGYVIDIEGDEDMLESLDTNELENQSVEYAISQVIASAQQDGNIESNENALVGCFGDDAHNNISKNQVMYYLQNESYNINLMSVHGTMDDWESAQAMDISAGLYFLGQLSGVEIEHDLDLSALILMAEEQSGMSIAMLLNENSEPIVYDAPTIDYAIKDGYILLSWDYIDYKKNNYDGYITYRLICADSAAGLTNNPTIVDTYTFAVWDSQPIDYTLAYSDANRNKYYAITALYDDKTNVIVDEYIYVK